MELLGKIKIHELAKEIGMSSKDVLEKAKSLGIDVTSHLSNVTDEQATEIRNAYSKNNKNNVKKENKVENKRIFIEKCNSLIIFLTVWFPFW